MNAVENIRAALADATNGPWIGAGPSFGAPHAEYLDSVVEDVDHDDAATICRDTETGDARYIAACNPAAMAEVLAHIDAQAAEIERLNYELTVANLREQLAQRGEPTFWLNEVGQLSATRGFAARNAPGLKLIPLYTHPQAPREQLMDKEHQDSWNHKCRLVVDTLLHEAGYHKDSSVRHNLAMMNFDASPAVVEQLAQQAPQVPMTEDEIVKCLVESRCIGKVMMSFESGPYDITRPSITADKLIRAIEAHHGIKEQPGQHPDDQAVDRFAVAMKAKLAVARAKGRGGWDDPAQCTVDHLSNLLHSHVAKGDPVDVANLAMMLHQRGSGIKEQS